MCDKPKLTPEMHKHLVQAIATGNTTEHAAQSSGISHKTFVRWLARGKFNKDAEHSLLYREVVQARSKIVCQINSVLLQALLGGNHNAGTFMLKRLSQDDYEEKIELHVGCSKSTKEEEKEDAL